MVATVVPALPNDEDAVFAMLLQLHDENGIFPVDEVRVREFIRGATGGTNHGLIGVIRGDAGLEASVGLVIDQWWYTLKYCLSERWVFVSPAARSRPEFDRKRGEKGHATLLMEWAQWCAQQFRVPLQMGIMSTQRTEAKERLYRRKMTPVGSLFMWDGDATQFKTGALN